MFENIVENVFFIDAGLSSVLLEAQAVVTPLGPRSALEVVTAGGWGCRGARGVRAGAWVVDLRGVDLLRGLAFSSVLDERLERPRAENLDLKEGVTAEGMMVVWSEGKRSKSCGDQG
jgi:hypothetical protein